MNLATEAYPELPEMAKLVHGKSDDPPGSSPSLNFSILD